jgi:hypothetical protein
MALDWPGTFSESSDLLAINGELQQFAKHWKNLLAEFEPARFALLGGQVGDAREGQSTGADQASLSFLGLSSVSVGVAL